jgi:glycerate kinase
VKVVIAPNAFKGSLSPLAAARAIDSGLRTADPDVDTDLAPLSDGGDGFLEVLLAARPAPRHKVVVRGPVHSPVAASYALEPAGRAVIEAAEACGMALLGAGSGGQADLDPMGASTGGVGELLAEARQNGANAFLVGVGGSASTDGGTGMARALGYRFLDGSGAELAEGGGHLHRLARIDSSGFDPTWMMLPVTVACDVDNPLFGELGAAAVYAPQKGANPDQVGVLDAGLRRLAEVIRSDLGVDVADLPAAGAAGGLGAGMAAFLGGRLEPGAELVMREIAFEKRLAGADLMITGEGRLDGQSSSGKATVAAGRLAHQLGVRSVALVGSLGPGWEAAAEGVFDDVRATTPEGMSTSEAMRRAPEILAAAAAGVQLG